MTDTAVLVRRLAAAGLGLVVGVVPFSGVARAAVTEVGCGEGAAEALVRAVDDANAAGEGTIALAAGCTYTLTDSAAAPTPDPVPAHMRQGFGPRGLPVITGKVTIEGNGATVRRDPQNPKRFGILGVAPFGQLTLKQATISGGRADRKRDNDNNAAGGGIYNWGGMVALDSATITGNTARTGGGGIYNSRYRPKQYPNTVTLNNSTITGNRAIGSGGGINNSGTVTAVSSHIDTNRAYDGSTASTNHGGGIHNTLLGTVTLKENSTVNGNTAKYAAGINNTFSGKLRLESSSVNGNIAQQLGGGIRNNSSSRDAVTLISSHVDNNEAVADGGIETSNGTVALEDSTVNGNTSARDGGGISTTVQGTVTLISSQVNNNRARSGKGGGIYNFGTVTVSSSHVDNNEAGTDGGGIYVDRGTVTVKDGSSVSGNRPNNCSGRVSGC